MAALVIEKHYGQLLIESALHSLIIDFHILHRNIDSEWNMWSEAGGPAYGEMAGPNNFKYTDGGRIKDDLCKLWNM